MRRWIVLLLLSLLGLSARAETECGEYHGRPVCTVGILSSDFEEQDATVATGNVQERRNWCWAASISMIFKWYGFSVPQATVVRQTFGDMRNAPASGQQMTAQLNRSYKTEDGRAFRVRATVSDLPAGRLSVDNNKIIESLEQGRPLIIGAQGHAMVLTAVRYIKNPATGKPMDIIGAVVRDPWPGRGRRELTPVELHPFYVANISIEGQGERQKADLERIERCLDACTSQAENCLDATTEQYERCTDNSAPVCDACPNYSGALWEMCDKRCDRMREACSTSTDRKREACSRNGSKCRDRCK